MCGLAGLAIGPGCRMSRQSREALLAHLLVLNESRGDHATGVAACGGIYAPPTVKAAAPATAFVGSDMFRRARAIWKRDRCTTWIGHTRYATHANREQDDAAHPFTVGRITGAHNGVIYNWRAVEKSLGFGPSWIVDSQAAFGALDMTMDAPTALGMLEGYAGLVWWSEADSRLHLTRAGGAQLSAAYSAALQMLVWSSDERHLKQALEPHSEAGWHVWELTENVVYSYDPRLFGEKAGVVKTPYVWKARVVANDMARTNGKANQKANQKVTISRWNGSRWDATQAREIFDDYVPPANSLQSEMALGADRYTSLRKVGKALDALIEQVDEMRAKIETLEAEKDYMLGLLDRYGFMDTPECVTCGKGGGELLQLPNGGVQHAGCIFAGAGA